MVLHCYSKTCLKKSSDGRVGSLCLCLIVLRSSFSSRASSNISYSLMGMMADLGLELTIRMLVLVSDKELAPRFLRSVIVIVFIILLL